MAGEFPGHFLFELHCHSGARSALAEREPGISICFALSKTLMLGFRVRSLRLRLRLRPGMTSVRRNGTRKHFHASANFSSSSLSTRCLLLLWSRGLPRLSNDFALRSYSLRVASLHRRLTPRQL